MIEPPYRISLSVAHSDPDLPPVHHFGTVRYSGPVPPTSGTWLGVEWDDVGRGKHSGEYAPAGVRYFDCRRPGAGTFIRPTAKGLSTGTTFISAINQRYLGQLTSPTPPPPAPQQSSQSPTTSTRYHTNFNKEIEIPSLDQITARFQQLDRLTTAGLEYAQVATAGDQAELVLLGTRMSKLRTLNLSFSLLSSLREVDKIATPLAALDTLIINSNRFNPTTEPTQLPGFARLTSLSLNQTLLSWAELVHLAPSLPNLRHLELGYNNLTALAPPRDARSGCKLINLEKLNLEGNELVDWGQLADELSNLPAISRLILSNNRISAIPPPSATAQTPRLARLRHLDLTNNLLANWSAIDALNHLPALESVNLSGNPFLAGEEAEAGGTTRLQLIGRIGRITKLEGTPIRPFERDDAERFYLAMIAKDAGLQTEEQRSVAHPRYAELVQKHGSISTPEPKPTMRGRLITLRIELPPDLAPATHTPSTLSVLPTLRTILLRSHIAKLAGRPMPKTKFKLMALLAPTALSAEPGGDASAPAGVALEVEIPAAEEGRELGYWGLGDGDGIRVVGV